jgi:hypothetical protein
MAPRTMSPVPPASPAASATVVGPRALDVVAAALDEQFADWRVADTTPPSQTRMQRPRFGFAEASPDTFDDVRGPTNAALAK